MVLALIQQAGGGWGHYRLLKGMFADQSRRVSNVSCANLSVWDLFARRDEYLHTSPICLELERSDMIGIYNVNTTIRPTY